MKDFFLFYVRETKSLFFFWGAKKEGENRAPRKKSICSPNKGCLGESGVG